jgi:hypothetical protein
VAQGEHLANAGIQEYLILKGLRPGGVAREIGESVAYSGAAPEGGKQNLEGETKMAKKIKKLNKSTKVEAGKTLRKLGIG